MAEVVADRIWETTETEGTGALTLLGHVESYRDFNDVMVTGDWCLGFIGHQTENEYEVNTFTMQANGTLTRANPPVVTFPDLSTQAAPTSNSGSLVAFSAGTKDVVLDTPAGIRQRLASLILNARNPNLFFAGPATGSADAPDWRVIDDSDIPDLSAVYALTSHTHTSGSVTDFSEAVDDRVAVLIQNGTGITWSYNDAAGTLTPTIAASGVLPVADTQTIVKGSVDATKLLRFEVDGFTTGTTRVLTPPNADATIAGLEVAQTFTQEQTFTESGNTFVIDPANKRLSTPSGFCIGLLATITDTNQPIAIGNLANAADGGVAIGYDADASGTTGCVAIGYSSTSSGTSSFALGFSAAATNINSLAIGRDSTSSGNYTIALQNATGSASGNGAFAACYASSATGAQSVAIGLYSNAGHTNALAFGYGAITSAAGDICFAANDQPINFGFQQQTSTGSIQTQAQLRSSWSVSTHASRAGLLKIGTFYTTTFQEGIRITSASTGCVVTIGNDANYDGLVVNESGEDADTRIEGDTDANLVFVDASADTVQIGAATASDSAKFYVAGKISTSGEMEINGNLNHDGSNVGFFGTAPAAQSTGWSVSNVTTDKTFDANATSIDEIADVLGSLIDYLKSLGILGA